MDEPNEEQPENQGENERRSISTIFSRPIAELEDLFEKRNNNKEINEEHLLVMDEEDPLNRSPEKQREVPMEVEDADVDSPSKQATSSEKPNEEAEGFSEYFNTMSETPDNDPKKQSEKHGGGDTESNLGEDVVERTEQLQTDFGVQVEPVRIKYVDSYCQVEIEKMCVDSTDVSVQCTFPITRNMEVQTDQEVQNVATTMSQEVQAVYTTSDVGVQNDPTTPVNILEIIERSSQNYEFRHAISLGFQLAQSYGVMGHGNGIANFGAPPNMYALLAQQAIMGAQVPQPSFPSQHGNTSQQPLAVVPMFNPHQQYSSVNPYVQQAPPNMFPNNYGQQLAVNNFQPMNPYLQAASIVPQNTSVQQVQPDMNQMLRFYAPPQQPSMNYQPPVFAEHQPLNPPDETSIPSNNQLFEDEIDVGSPNLAAPPPLAPETTQQQYLIPNEEVVIEMSTGNSQNNLPAAQRQLEVAPIRELSNPISITPSIEPSEERRSETLLIPQQTPESSAPPPVTPVTPAAPPLPSRRHTSFSEDSDDEADTSDSQVTRPRSESLRKKSPVKKTNESKDSRRAKSVVNNKKKTVANKKEKERHFHSSSSEVSGSEPTSKTVSRQTPKSSAPRRGRPPLINSSDEFSDEDVTPVARPPNKTPAKKTNESSSSRKKKSVVNKKTKASTSQAQHSSSSSSDDDDEISVPPPKKPKLGRPSKEDGRSVSSQKNKDLSSVEYRMKKLESNLSTSLKKQEPVGEKRKSRNAKDFSNLQKKHAKD